MEEHGHVSQLDSFEYPAKFFCSIPYARFDGQLSARKRQEVLERFSIPLDPDESPAPGEPLPTTRRRETQTEITVDEDDTNTTDGNDLNLVAGNDTDDDFDEDISTRVKKSKAKGKGKGKAKVKAIPAVKQVFDGSAFYAENPKVLLISLKAGALGLNLTVANHVFL